jgi:hypothetical protein
VYHCTAFPASEFIAKIPGTDKEAGNFGTPAQNNCKSPRSVWRRVKALKNIHPFYCPF